MSVYNITATIVTYKNEHKVLMKAINSFLNTKLNVKIYIVDNSPTDIIKNLCIDSRAEYIFNNNNLGFGAGHNIIMNDPSKLGKYHIVLNPDIYFECDALFLPTLLECSTANFPEAMKMKKPILTSNLPFATNVCQNAASYFNPMHPEDIADKILHFVESKTLRRTLVEAGNIQLKQFLSSEERAAKYLELCNNISSDVKNN